MRFKLPLAGEPEAAPPIVSLEKSCVTDDDEDELIIWLLGRVDEPNYHLQRRTTECSWRTDQTHAHTRTWVKILTIMIIMTI